MSSKTPSPGRSERLAKALRDNLARRKALARAKRARDGADATGERPARGAEPPAREEGSS